MFYCSNGNGKNVYHLSILIPEKCFIKGQGIFSDEKSEET